MRYLQASNYDFKKVYELIKENIKNTEDSLRIIDRRIKYILNSGLIYMHGRDCHFRPIIVVEAEKANELMDKSYFTGDLSKLNNISKNIFFIHGC